MKQEEKNKFNFTEFFFGAADNASGQHKQMTQKVFELIATIDSVSRTWYYQQSATETSGNAANEKTNNED